MKRIVLENRIISSTTKVWYVAVGGASNLDGAMSNLHEFADRVKRDHIWGAIIDLRRLQAFPPPTDWTSFCRGVRMKTPEHMRIAVVINPALPTRPIAEFVQAGRDGGGLMNAYRDWVDALKAVRLPVTTEDPLDSPKEVLLLD